MSISGGVDGVYTSWRQVLGAVMWRASTMHSSLGESARVGAVGRTSRSSDQE
jgi:hypothetical protein